MSNLLSKVLRPGIYRIGDKVFAAGFVPPPLLACKTYGEVARNTTDGCFE